MAHALDGCRAKIERAKELIDYLDADIKNFMQENRYSVIGKNQPELNRYAFWVEGPEVPHRVSVIAGEVIHHLRSALDHVIWSFAKTTRAIPSNRIQFPVSDTPKRFKDAVKAGYLDGVPKSAQPLIESLQPYRSNPPENSVLKILHTLDIADKHRLLIVLTTAMHPGPLIDLAPHGGNLVVKLPPAAMRSIFHRAIENGREVQWLQYEPDAPEFTVKNDFAVAIAFQEVGALMQQPVIPTLENLSDSIKGYIEEFACFFAAETPHVAASQR